VSEISTEGLSELVELTCAVVSAFVTKNNVSASDLPKLIADVHQAFATLGAPAAPIEVEAAKPAVSVRKSITPDFLICLEDGRKFKSLKRHLSQLGLTPEEYRTKWNLPKDYPMVAPNYSASRSALAKSIGLGRKPAASAPAKKQVRRKVAA
jgi:predicted transcriptional regulator